MGLRAELLHPLDGALQLGLAGIAALAHRLRGVQRVSGALGAVLLGGRNRLGTVGDFAHCLELRLQAAGELLGAEGDLSGGKRVVAGVARQILGQLTERRRRIGSRRAVVCRAPDGEPGP